MRTSPVEALLYEAIRDGSLQCGVCERRCIIEVGRSGFCGSRMNIDGRLYALAYGNLQSVTFNPIEKKPLFHYYPGSRALSAGSMGCNLRCVYCQNYTLSMANPDPERAVYTSPKEFVALALERGAEGLSFTFNEASCTLLEYILDCFELAEGLGLYRNLNTNGYMTPEALDLLIGAGLDSLCLDIKGDEVFYRRFCNGADPGPVWRNALRTKEKGLHLEVVNLVIPGANDGKETLMEIIARTRDDLGSDTPLHFTKFYPAYRAREYGLGQVTPVTTLERARELALRLGLDFIYIGNVPGHEGEETRCPGCGEKLIDRYAYRVLNYKVTNDGRCPNCGRKIPVTGKPTSNPQHLEVR